MGQAEPIAPSRRRRFGLVAAVYNVARYLPDFIASIERQTYPLDDVRVIAVDDGSTDDSRDLLLDWRQRRPALVQVLTKPNGGQGSARNLGLARADSTWLSFPDPDDMLAADYLAQVAATIDAHPELAMVATNRVIYREATGQLLARHPLRTLFASGDQIKNLNSSPTFFHGSAPAAFFRADLIERHGLRFDERIKPNFEDGHFCQRYLLEAPAPIVAFLGSAVYKYRRRADRSSTLQLGNLEPSRFREVIRHGYLELLEHAAARTGGRAPEWVQNMIIYELSYYISPEDSSPTPPSACHGALATEFVTLLRAIRTQLDDEVIAAFDTRRLEPHWRQLLLYGLRPDPWHSPYLVPLRYDRARQQVLVSFRFTGAEPPAEFTCGGEPVEPVVSKVRSFTYWDHVLLRERLAWLPAQATLRWRLGGRLVGAQPEWSDYVPTSIRPATLRRILRVSRRRPPVSQRLRDAVSRERARAGVFRLAAHRGPAARAFRGAWVLMDRVEGVADNARWLFEYLRSERPEINAWFVLSRRSPEWTGLRRRFGARVIDYGSRTWTLLMLNCRHLISSQLDASIQCRQELVGLAQSPHWRFTFVPPDVISQDLSRRLNPRQIDLMVTSTPAEHESIVGDDTDYVLTAKEVRRTGLARFDRLHELGSRTADDDQRLVLVAPSWLNWLTAPPGRGDAPGPVSSFIDTEYATNWSGLLASDQLARWLPAHQLDLVFLPPAELRPVPEASRLPTHVTPVTTADQDLAELLARTALLITDYSSLAFDAAYLNRPVVYFQFDRPPIELGGQTGRKGYFDYDRDGFGPVATTLPHAVRAALHLLSSGPGMAEPYTTRRAATFPERDGRCRERIVAAIEAL